MVAATMNTTVAGLQGRPVAAAAPTSGQLLAWSGSAWTPQGPYLPTTGGTITGTLSLSGAMTTPSLQTSGNAGSLINAAGRNVVTTYQYNGIGAFSAAWVTNSLAFLMGGVNCTVQMAFSGYVLMAASCQLATDSPNCSASVGVRYGTGTPPTHGQTGTPGTQVPGFGTTSAANANTNSLWTCWSQVGGLQGLTVGTTYWFDFMMSAVNAGSAYMQWASLQAIEI